MKVLAVFAHPDDETMLTGGTLADLARLGAEVFYLCATRGEGGDLGTPPLCTRENVGTQREAELACAVHALHGSALHFMNYVDPVVGADDTLYAFDGELELFAAGVVQEIHTLQIEAVITHGSEGEYGHPAHLKVHQGVSLAVNALPEAERPLFYTFQAAFAGHPKERVMNTADPAHVLLDIHHVQMEKLAAITCHRTQHALFVRHVEEEADGSRPLEKAVMPLESLHRVWPPVTELPIRDVLVDLLRQDEGVTVLEKLSIPAESSPDHH